jgi:anaerobic selenocysteine-containing dehydrogenase
MPAKSNPRVVKSICRMCMGLCGIDAHVDNGRLVRVTPMKEHPINRLCVKAQAMADWLYSPERITHPLRKVNGAWHEVSWDEALGIISEKLAAVKENYGAKALVVHTGQPIIGTEVTRMAIRFCSLYGTPNYTSAGSLCFAAKGLGHGLTLSNRMFSLSPSYGETGCIVVWGRNPQESKVDEQANVLAAYRRGAKLIVVDPRATPLARRADLHVQLRPGTDCALALGLLNIIIGEDLYDREFVERWTIGFDKLAGHVKDHPIEAVAGITGVPAAKIKQFARLYAQTKPATITQGVSIDHSPNGVQNSRAIAILVAITGNLDVVGGNVYSAPLGQSSLRVKGIVNVNQAVSADFPIYNKFTSEATAMPVADAIITGRPYPVKALLVQAANPALAWPDSQKVRQALESLDLLVVSDLFMTKTAKMADIFLPAAAFLENKFILDYATEGMALIVLSQKAVEPPPGCIEDRQLWVELGRRMGYKDYFPWQNADELFSYLLEPSGVTLEQLEQNPGGIVYRRLDQQRKYEQEGFSTPSGKVEIFSQVLADYGYDPLPTFTPPEPQTEGYPFNLITGTRTIGYSHSGYRNLARLRKLVPEPLVDINPQSAKGLAIADGEPVVLESPRGSITLKAKLTGDVPAGVLSIQHGWEEANANILTSNQPQDPISGYPGLKTVPCQVRKIRE